MRADRLLAALMILQAKGQVTAAELAAELEVSVRTARRDLEALGMSGVPVYPTRGKGGGWQLVGGYRTDLSGLTAHEARALFLVAGPSASGTPEVRAALRKLLGALPEPLRAEAQAASAAVVVDPSGWGRGTPAHSGPTHLDPLRDAVIARRRVDLGYASRQGEATERTIDPFGLVAKRGVWYLVAGTEAGLRTFRVDRVRSVAVRDDTVEVPEDFDLGAVWADVLDRVDGMRYPLTVTVAADAEAMPYLLGRYGERVRPVAPIPAAASGDGRAVLAISFPSPSAAVIDLAAHPRNVEVLDPPEVRSQMAALGAELVACYG